MKKLILAAVFAAAGISTTQAGGPNFGLLPCHIFNWGGCKNNCNFVVRPYNAFSPVCSGTIFCDGFMPISSGCPQGGSAHLNYSDGVPQQLPMPQAPKKGAWMYPPQGQYQYYPVFMQAPQQIPYQVIPLQQVPTPE